MSEEREPTPQATTAVTPVATPAASPAPAPAEATGRRGCLGTTTATLGVLASLVYILNPGLGVFELLPDNLPGVGNLDEAGAAALLIFGLRYLFRRPSRGP